ncbi:MAG: FAD-dependent oxidoreductase [Rhodocyclaceae bacterium]|nr:FAD-dependent oxidoreductase [Rhodocyclaceae bacterium]
MRTPHYDIDIAVIGASLGGVLAAWRACEAGRRVVLTNEFAWIGGQLTAQGVPPDEHRLIEFGGASESYLAFRRAMRAHYLALDDFVDNTEMTEGCNPGDGWVSRLCIEPTVALAYLENLLSPHIKSGRLVLLRDVRLIGADQDGRSIREVRCLSAAGETVSIHARLFLDATDTGELIQAAGLPYRLGKESHAEFGERDAPEAADRLDQQPCTVVVALARTDKPQAPIRQPASYVKWCQYRVPHYDYALFSNSIPGAGSGKSIELPLFGEGQTLDLWRYRRIVSSRNWRTPRVEISLINWAQNDYALSPLLDGPIAEHDVVAAAKELTASLVFWLQTDAPNADGGRGHPQLQLAADVLGTDGFAQQVYVRESRRIVGRECLAQSQILANPTAGGIVEPFHANNSVGVVWYNMDIHPTCVSGHSINAMVRPFTLPLGCFVPRDCDNLIPSCKNISVTHLVNAATRTHPTEWLIGEVAALLADYALTSGQTPADIHATDERVREFQRKLSAAGIPMRWDEALLEPLTNMPAHSLEV